MAEGKTLSEHESKRILAAAGVPLAREELAATPAQAAQAAARVGFPVAAKLCGPAIAHKSERNLVRLNLHDADAVQNAAAELLASARAEDGAPEKLGVLVAEMVAGKRELLAGVVRDPQFGACVSLGLGGVLTEALADAAFAAAPLTPADARRMALALRAHRLLLLHPFRGEAACNLDALAEVLIALGRLALARPDIRSVDVNPLLLRADGMPVAVDALVEIAPAKSEAQSASESETKPESIEKVTARAARLRPLFAPRGIAITGVSQHPGKFGFVTFHNLLRFGYRGKLFPLSRDGAPVLGRPTLKSVMEIPPGEADLVFVCTPHSANMQLLQECAARGVKAAFIASAGYGEAGEAGRARQAELTALAKRLGMAVAGPNGQGVVATGPQMCAQIVAPFPPQGGISIASQSGNLVSSFMHYAVASGVGVANAISAGNSAQLGLADYLEYFALDEGTRVALAYLEGLPEGGGRRFLRAARFCAARKPLVLVKGGAHAAGARAAASHTGALASDDKIFQGVAMQAGAIRAPSPEAAYEWAATFATQPLPSGPRTVVFTTAGGWGVLAADACAAHGLELIPLPADLRAAINELVPPRWSRNNPIDLAGGETRDTVPEVLHLIAAHREVDAVVHLGIGIQAAQAQVFESGAFAGDEGVARIAAFHKKQDARYAAAAREASTKHGKPVLTATELVHADAHYGNAGPQGVREGGRLCYASAQRACAALAAMRRYAQWRESARAAQC